MDDHLHGCEADECHERVERPTQTWRPGFGWVWRYLCATHTGGDGQS